MSAMNKLSLMADKAQDQSDVTIQEALVRRAARLAQTPSEQDASEQIDLLLARLGSEIYGMEAQYVDRVQEVDYLTHVPRVPHWVAGVTNLRGQLLSVIDMARLFGLETRQAGGSDETPDVDYLVVVNSPKMELALLVDEVMTVETMPVSSIREPASTLRGMRPEYVRGIVERAGGSMVIVLDLATLLADERLIVHQEVS